jgi:hypothetical protein
MEIAENNHLQLTLPLNKITCQEQLFSFFEKELQPCQSKIDKNCFKELLQNLSTCQGVQSHNAKTITLNIIGWKTMSRKNERLFDYFMDILKYAENNRTDGIMFNYKLIE